MSARRSPLPAVLLLGLAAAGGYLIARTTATEPPRPSQTRELESEASREPLRAPDQPLYEGELFAAPVEPGDAEGADSWAELNNRATLELAEGRLAVAVEMLERCHAASPEDDVFRRNLAEALVRLARAKAEERRLEAAIRSLERALVLAPDREDADLLARIAQRWRREVEVEEEHWTEDSDLFELSYDTRRVDILHRSQEVLDHLEESYETLASWFGRDPVRTEGRPRIRVVLYRREEFGRLTGLGDWAGGAFDGVVRVAVEDLEEERARWRRVLVHELVHAFVHELGGPAVPGWLNEGLAQLLEGRDLSLALQAADRRLGDRFFPLERLEGSLATWSDPTEIGQAYAQSLLMVQRLGEEYGEEVLRRMVVGYAEGRSAEQSFEAWASVPLEFGVALVRDR